MIYESLILCCWMGMFSKVQVQTVQPQWEQMDGENTAPLMIKMAQKIIPASTSVLCRYIYKYISISHSAHPASPKTRKIKYGFLMGAYLQSEPFLPTKSINVKIESKQVVELYIWEDFHNILHSSTSCVFYCNSFSPSVLNTQAFCSVLGFKFIVTTSSKLSEEDNKIGPFGLLCEWINVLFSSVMIMS